MTCYDSALDYAVARNLSFWCDSQLVVYVEDARCVVASVNSRALMRDGEFDWHEHADASISGDLLWTAWLAALNGCAQCLGFRDYQVVYGNGTAVVVHRGRVAMIGAQTRLIEWDGTDDGKRMIGEAIRDATGRK